MSTHTDNSSTRETIETGEAALSPYAARAAESRGRARNIAPCPVRTCFQRDRDRILHSKAFRRLAQKTQVFLAPRGDHYRTRLTHTLEVSQISRTVARALALNEDLTEAIALGHDLGHTPFGHVGENALDSSDRLVKPYRHNEQSLRIVDVLEDDGRGLNLSWEVRDGILRHTGTDLPETLEGRIVRIADRIAYINHDIDDAVRAGVISERDLPAGPVAFFGSRQSDRISTMVKDLIACSTSKPDIRMSDDAWRLMNELRDFLFHRVYTNSIAKTEDVKQTMVLRSLFDYFCDNPGALPAEFRPDSEQETTTRVVDYIAGMTDRFAIKTYEDLFVPKVWDDTLGR